MAITRIKVFPDDIITNAKVGSEEIVNADVNPSADIAQSKISGLSTSLSSLCTSITSANTTVTSACAQK